MIDIAVLFKCFGAACSYPIIIGDLMPKAMMQLTNPSNIHSFIYYRRTWIVFAYLVASPLCFFKTLDALKFTSAISLASVLSLTVMMVLYSLHVPNFNPCDTLNNSSICSNDIKPIDFSVESIKVISIFVYVFTCQHNTFAVVNELKKPTQSRLNTVFIMSISTGLLLYFAVGISGYATYGSNIYSDALKSYPESHVTSACRVFVAMIVAFHIPLQTNPARRSALSIWTKISSQLNPTDEMLNFRFVVVTTLFILSTFLVSFNVTELGIAFSLVGATGSTAVTYVVPGMCYYSLHKNQGPVWKRRLAGLLCLFGMMLAPTVLFFIFQS